MTGAEFDKLIKHHDYQALFWPRASAAHKHHTKWAADLRRLKEVVMQLTTAEVDTRDYTS